MTFRFHIFVAFFVAFAVQKTFADQTTDLNSEATPILQSENTTAAYHINHAALGAKEKEDVATIQDMIHSRESAELIEMVVEGKAIYIPAGSVCYVERHSDSSTKCQIRVAGETGLWWIALSDLDEIRK